MSNHHHYDATHQDNTGEMTHEYCKDGQLRPIKVVVETEQTAAQETQETIDAWFERVQLADAVVRRYDGWGGDHIANATLMAGIIMAMSVSDVMDSLDKMNGETSQ